MDTKMERYQVKSPSPWNEPGTILDFLLLTPEEAKEVEAVLQAEYPGAILVKVHIPNYRRLTGKYTLP